MQITEKNISMPLKSLRAKLAETQEGMARRLGCTFAGYRKWEYGTAMPSGGWLIKILRLCPDEESLEEFGIDLAGIREAGQAKEDEATKQGQRGALLEPMDIRFPKPKRGY